MKNEGLVPVAIEKIKILGAVLELPALPIQPILPDFLVLMGKIGSAV